MFVLSCQRSTVTFVYDASLATALCPPVPSSDNGHRASIRAFTFQQRSTSGRLPCTAREPDACVGSGVELATKTKFHPPPHFQQRKWPATTMAQHPPQKWCVILDLPRSHRSYIRPLPTGHSLVPATIPRGTILYHGRGDHRIPISPDWLAFDFEHAYFFCRQSCYVISLQAKRDLRLVYFDGLSAGKMKDGPLDSQDVILWGRPQPDKYFSEMERIKSLCDWGRPLGLDGFVRMEFHLCVHWHAIVIAECPVTPGC